MIKKIVLSLILIGLVVVTPVFAANDIDMNLAGNTANESQNNTNQTGNTSQNNTNTGASDNTSSTRVSTLDNANQDSELGLTNIINIVLVVIGILLVLLSIAILIRLKK